MTVTTITDQHGTVEVTIAPGHVVRVAHDLPGAAKNISFIAPDHSRQVIARHRAVQQGLLRPVHNQLTSNELATLLGTHPESIRRFGRLLGVGRPPRNRRGEWQFTPDDALAIAPHVRRDGRPPKKAETE